MKTMRIPQVLRKSAPTDVGCAADGEKVVIFGSEERRKWRCSFDPAQAVKLWRCLMGEYSTAVAVAENGDTVKLWNHVDPELSDIWELVDKSGERLFRVDADQALALAWAVERCCASALRVPTPTEDEVGRGPTA